MSEALRATRGRSARTVIAVWGVEKARNVKGGRGVGEREGGRGWGERGGGFWGCGGGGEGASLSRGFWLGMGEGYRLWTVRRLWLGR